MEKLCIVKRRSKPTEQGRDSTATIVTQEKETVVEAQDVQELDKEPSSSLSSTFNIHDGDHLIFKEVAGDRTDILHTVDTPTIRSCPVHELH